MIGKILVVDDEANQRDLVAGFLGKKGHLVQAADSGESATERFNEEPFDLVITDLKMKGADGVEVLRSVKETNPTTGVILVSAFGTVETAVEAMKLGADDFLVKPINLEQLDALVQKSLERSALVRENRDLKNRLSERYSFEAIVGDSGAMQEALNIAGRAARSKATVLIRGESGTGKGLLANAVHLASDRADGSFTEINCAALSPGVLESELFGHEKGAFTGADRQRRGLFEQADGGTLFVDEVGDVPMEIQVKLLNVIQSGAFYRVGGNHPIRVDVRLIAATHRDLERFVEEGRFREDLYYRLNVVSVVIPPLRDRRSDIPELAEHFIDKFSLANGKSIRGISPTAMDRIVRYQYPGNVRELENTIERAVVLARSDVIEYEDLPSTLRESGPNEATNLTDQIGQRSLSELVETLEKQAIRQALEMAGGVQTKAAEILGIGERNLRYKIVKYAMKSEKE